MNLVTAREREAQVAVGRAQVSGRRLAQRERDWVVPLGRLGYAANGLVYLLIGVLAVQAPFGRLLLAIVAIGLVGYALWRMLQAMLDTEHQGNKLKGILARCGYAISAFTYAGLAFRAAVMLTGGAAAR